MKVRAAVWLLVLGTFFFGSYTFANWVSAQRTDLPSFALAWEHKIPFIAWTIVFYWSIDLLYAASLFACRSRHELDTHALRLLAVQVFSVSIFLICPLRFSFTHPAPGGLPGLLFGGLSAFDRPFNQAPSLHLGIGAILWVFYSARFRGAIRFVLQSAIALACISTLTTYQHHFIDLPTGVAAGLIAVGLFPMGYAPGTRLAAAYFAGASLFAAAALRSGGIHVMWLWPSLALLVPSAAYASGRPGLFRKRSIAMTLLMTPYLAVAWLNSRLRREPAVQHIASDVWIGRAAARPQFGGHGFRSAVDVTAEFRAWRCDPQHRCVPMLDLVPPTPAQLRSAVNAIEELGTCRPTIVYCALGYSRSAAAIAAWLVSTGRAASVSDAIQLIREQRPQVRLDIPHAGAIAEAVHVS